MPQTCAGGKRRPKAANNKGNTGQEHSMADKTSFGHLAGCSRRVRRAAMGHEVDMQMTGGGLPQCARHSVLD
eukprot:CAMPEP_0177348574 /NCGR_PEP_ID=MMETSP0368-20130122/30338_1 /TAXON_ID=447022 ORGANISM="Scrippsiella hangoei-like, Strain SHHI-4" /NCGR_SAMPLE_ID=MMETSP0368 /ASSEMBLY_ACC=CAM_ASM_000363 /LENGTH=71 /DNA_ID=CAMNT_0018810395 /DNA_START=37 /DNA_END=249 /DNA_ORIENTATION=+